MALEISRSRMENGTEVSADDPELITAFRTQDPDAFETVVRLHSAKIGAYLRRQFNFNAPDVEDIMQETFLKAYLHSGTYEQRAALSTWLISIARFTAL